MTEMGEKERRLMGTVRRAVTSRVSDLTFNYPLRFENFKGRSEM